jgi:hypothetical protein
MSGHTVPLNVPPGLEYLIPLDRLYVKQKVELLEGIFLIKLKAFNNLICSILGL